jgi:hypothetical protein
MPTKRFTHNKKKIVIDSDDKEIRLSIDGEKVGAFAAKGTGKFYTPYLPYEGYASVDEMAKALVTHFPRYMPKEPVRKGR